MEMAVSFIGTSGSVPTARRGLSALLLRHGSSRILFDCGEGTQRQLARSVGLVDVDAVFITHYHADHWLGLPGLLKTFDLRDRDRPLQIFGPPGLDRIMGLIEAATGRTRFRVNAEELDAGDAVEFSGLSVDAFSVRHRGVAFGYAAIEPDRPGHIDLERAAALGIEPGPDLGRLQRGEEVNGVSPADVMGDPRSGRRVVLSGDTSPCDMVREAAWKADLLVHEATFLDADRERALKKGHSTARQAAELAREAEVKLLVLNHVSSRYAGGELRDEARDVFERCDVARDFDRVTIPFPERGDPVLERKGAKLKGQRPDQPSAEEAGIVADEV